MTERLPHPSDLALVPADLDASGTQGCFEVTPGLSRHDGIFYGGAGAAVAVIAMEAATQRDALWVVTQFVAPAQLGERIRWTATTTANGTRVAQVQVVGNVDDRVVFLALGATAVPRSNGLTGDYLTMPAASSPDESGPMRHGPAELATTDVGFHRNVELREAQAEDQPPNTILLWARLTSGADFTRAGIAFVADMVPVAVARAAGRLGAGSSLDNSLRFASIVPTEWVLLELRGEMASEGYGHGSLNVWSENGALLATGGQTASMTHLFD